MFNKDGVKSVSFGYLCAIKNIKVFISMSTAVITQSNGSPKTQSKQIAGKQQKEPKRLSKLGKWMRDNPGGIAEYVDWQYINRMRH